MSAARAGEFHPQPPVEAQQFRRAPFATGNGCQNGNRGTEFAADSSLEGTGFEPSVPLQSRSYVSRRGRWQSARKSVNLMGARPLLSHARLVPT
jgi:hypothetical protein